LKATTEFRVRLKKAEKERLIRLNLSLAIALVISVFLNVFLCIQLGKLRSNSHNNANWKEKIGLNNPFTALVWAFLALTIVLGLIGLIGGLSTL